MICIVLAAGYATRMYPLTENFPKPLLEVKGRTILDWLINDVDDISRIERILVVSNHRFIGHFQKWLANANYSKPITLLDDGSNRNEERVGAVIDIQVALRNVLSPTDALVIAGDNVLEFSFRGFVDYFNAVGRSCVMCYSEPDADKRRKTGIITVDGRRRVTSFAEKPAYPQNDLAVPPFYCYTASDLNRIDEAVSNGSGKDAPGSLAAWLSRNGELFAWPMPGKRYDIGSLDGYREVQSLYTPYSKRDIM